METPPVAPAIAPVAPATPPVVPDTPPVVPATPPIVPAGDPNWYDSALSANDKDREYATINDYVESNHALRSMISQKGILPPTAESTPVQRDEFLEAVKSHLPAEIFAGKVPEAYEIEMLTKNEALDDARRAGVTDAFRKLGMTNEQAVGVMDMFGRESATDIELNEVAKAAMMAGSMENLKAEWGDDFDERKDGVLSLAERHPEAMQILTDSGFLGNQAVFTMLDEAHRATAEDSIATAQANRAGADAEYEAYVSSPAYKEIMRVGSRYAQGDPEFDQAVAKAHSLLARSLK